MRNKNRYSGQCLLPLMAISSDTIPSRKVNVLWDSGATFSLITFKKANQLNLISEEISISVIKVGGKKKQYHPMHMISHFVINREESQFLGFMALIKYLQMPSISVLKVFFIYSMT